MKLDHSFLRRALQAARGSRLLYLFGFAWALLSYYGVEIYAHRYLCAAAETPLTFGFAWALLLAAVVYLLPRRAGKLVYGLTYFPFACYAVGQCGYYAIFGRMMWLTDILYASEGGDYLGDVLGLFSKGFYFATALLLLLGIVGVFLVGAGRRPERLRTVCAMTGLAAAIGLFAYPAAVFRQDNAQGVWGTQKEYRRALSAEGIYTTMYDAYKLYNICGLYQSTAKDLWSHHIYPKTPMYQKESVARTAEIDTWFDERPAHEDNEMTGLLAGKNVVLVLMESMDDFLIDEEATPTIQRLMNKGINFTNFYTPGYGSVRTFNSEFCINTGLYLPTNGQYAFNYCTNDFSQSLPNLFRALGYSAQTFHYNDVTFYNRGVMEPAMGYEAYNCYMNYGIAGDALLSDTALFSNEALMEKFYHGEEGEEYEHFFNFIITRNAHMTYDYEEEVSQFAFSQYPQFYGSTGYEEVDCIRAKAKLCDAMFARLLRSLEENGALENTVIIGVTDHYAYGMQDQGLVMQLSNVGRHLLVERTPCFVWYEGCEAMEVDKVLNTADFVPTMVNLFGLDSDYRYLGQDAFDENYDGYALFADHSWVTAQAAYQNDAVISEFTDEGVSAEMVAATNELCQTFVHMNNLLLESDYYGHRNAK